MLIFKHTKHISLWLVVNEKFEQLTSIKKVSLNTFGIHNVLAEFFPSLRLLLDFFTVTFAVELNSLNTR